MKLVIVESPTKAKTLSAILGKQFHVIASKGHVRDLPKKGLGIDIENNFEPTYEVSPDSKKIIAELKKNLKDVDSVVLATDLDREGEAIAWHLKHILSSTKEGKKLPYERVTFHEITKDAVLSAFDHAGELNLNLVDAQQARRVLDRLVGYKLSPILWKKVRFGLSAGRVQSVAVRLIVEREEERNKFIADEYWTVDADFHTDKKSEKFSASLVEIQNKKAEIKNEKDAKKIKDALEKCDYEVLEIKQSERKKSPYPPFKTSTLQQAAANLFGFNAKRTMSAAQKLFELGYITYHRTDSLNLSEKFLSEAREFISTQIGKQFIPDSPNYYKNSSKGAQEAHEAIRPTDLSLDQKKLKALKEDEFKIYTLIFKRTLESQMLPAVFDQTTVSTQAMSNNDKYLFRTVGSVIKFEGYLAVGSYMGLVEEKEEISILPNLSEGQKVSLIDIFANQHFTQPPARYTDATLIKKLEELGIGRPSTYAPTISTIQSRGYVTKEGRAFIPTDVAFVVTNLLKDHFKDVIDFDFTAQMEEEFDEIADGNSKWQPVIKKFYEPFEKNVLAKDIELKKADITTLQVTDEDCPKCGRKLNLKLGKYGRFLSCSGFPDDCDFAKPAEEGLVDENGNPVSFGDCDICADGKLILKQGKFGKFLACSNYPKCKNTKPFLEKIGMVCPKCNEGDVIVKKARGRTFYGCSRYPDCAYASWKNPMQNLEHILEKDSSD
mgnify:CR=1 FL=1